MVNQKQKEKFRVNRHHYFHIAIHIGLRESRIKLLKLSMLSLKEILTHSQFVGQKVLEKILYELKVQDRNRVISLTNFDGQLERDSQEIPYWNFYLQTSAVITARCFGKALSKELFHTQNVIDGDLKVEPISFSNP